MSELHLNLRSRVQPFKSNDQWIEIAIPKAFPTHETAILLCDIWNKHWCKSATDRCAKIAKRVNEVISFARKNGVQIIHAPSDTMDYYENYPQRKMMQDLPHVSMPDPRDLADPPQPIDDSDGGCDDQPQCEIHKAWTHQDQSIELADEDGITDRGQEVYNLLKSKRIENLIIMGVHTNMCVLGRSFAIKAMSRIGINCILIRDCTDAMYNPRKDPFVSHADGTELVIEYIEKHWCPSASSEDLLKVY